MVVLRMSRELSIYVSEFLPLAPTMADDVRRQVRHGLADVLEWLGEDVGPAPGEPTHAIQAGVALLVSPELAARLELEGKG